MGSGVGVNDGAALGRKVGVWEGNSVGWEGEGTWAGKSDGAGLGIQVGVFVGSELG